MPPTHCLGNCLGQAEVGACHHSQVGACRTLAGQKEADLVPILTGSCCRTVAEAYGQDGAEGGGEVGVCLGSATVDYNPETLQF